jgi:hypothetical protein
VEGAVRLLVTRFIPLTPKDLERWEMDVEEWMNQEENEDEQWEYELRVSLYSLYWLFAADVFCIAVCRTRAVNLVDAVQGLCNSYPASILRQCCGCANLCLMPRIISHEPSAQSSLELSDILAKEAIYCSVGRCSYSLKGAIPFQQCLDQYFIADVQNPDPK